MTTDRIWNSSPPPHVGWWNASYAKDTGAWRWWDGNGWSQPAFDHYMATLAGERATEKSCSVDTIQWTTYWPENARVPRVDPRCSDPNFSNVEKLMTFASGSVVAAPTNHFGSIMEGIDIPAVVHKAMFQSMVNKALSEGYVLTAHTVPQEPLAMGNYRVQVEVRKPRGLV